MLRGVRTRVPSGETFSAWGYAVELAFEAFTRFAAERNELYGLGATPSAVYAKRVWSGS